MRIKREYNRSQSSRVDSSQIIVSVLDYSQGFPLFLRNVQVLQTKHVSKIDYDVPVLKVTVKTNNNWKLSEDTTTMMMMMMIRVVVQ